MSTQYIDHTGIQDICHRTAVAFFNTDEPIGSYVGCNKALLDSALQLPKATYGGQELYKTLEEKAAALYYSLTKNHAFENGNKRIAIVTMITFLGINGYRTKFTNEELSERTIHVAESLPKDRDALLKDIIKWIQDHKI